MSEITFPQSIVRDLIREVSQRNSGCSKISGKIFGLDWGFIGFVYAEMFGM